MGEAWVRLPTDLVFDGGLSATEFRILAALLTYDWADSDGGRKGRVWPSVDVLAQRLGLHRNAVSRTLRSLCRKGYIVKAQERNGAGHWTHNVYHLVADRAQKSVHGEADRAQETVQPRTKNGAHRAQKSVHEERRREKEKTEEDEGLHPEPEGVNGMANDPRIRELMNNLRLKTAKSTYNAYLADLEARADGDGTLTIVKCNPMAAGLLRRLVEREAGYVGFASVVWPSDQAVA